MPLVAWGPSNHRATKNGATVLRPGRSELFGFPRPLLRGQDSERLLDSAGQVVQPAVGVTGRRVRGRVPGLFLQSPLLPRGQGDRARVAVEVETLRDQAGQCGGTETGPAGRGVQGEAVRPGQPAEDTLAGACDPEF